MTLLGIFGAPELIIIMMLIFIVPVFILIIVALVDIVRSKFEGNLQLIWILIVLFLNFVGAILYFIIGRNQKIKV